MTDTLSRCDVCRAVVDGEDLFCHNCGTECNEQSIQSKNYGKLVTHSFRCEGCGASMSYDASSQVLRCPFCGTEDLKEEVVHRTLRPAYVVPMGIDRGLAEARLRSFLGSSFWHPGDLGSEARLHKATPVYVPYWIYSASVHTNYTGDTNHTPHGARGDWFPVSGQHKGVHSGVLVSASSVLTGAETDSLLPFDLSKSQSPETVDLENITVEEFRRTRTAARPLAKSSLERLEHQICSGQIPGRSRNVRVNVMISDLTSQPTLLPVWILAYRYRDRVYRVLVNGQSGKLAGEAPTSNAKLFTLIGGILLLILLLVLVAAISR